MCWFVSDTDSHAALSQSDFQAVKDADGKAVPVTDYGDGTYSFVMPATAVSILPGFVPVGAGRFVDVPADAYYSDAVAWAIENGITNGVSDTAFAPDNIVTCAQTVAFLYRFAKASAEAAGVFDEVALDAWYAEAVTWAAEKGVTNGVDDTHFALNNDCTRGQIVTFLYRDMAG